MGGGGNSYEGYTIPSGSHWKRTLLAEFTLEEATRATAIFRARSGVYAALFITLEADSTGRTQFLLSGRQEKDREQ
jgi:hypothetical protein